MASSAIKKVNMITQIVRLRQIVQRWKTKSATRRRPILSSSTPSSSSTSSPKSRTPSGSLAVYVGSERRRFVIPTRFLNLPVFVALLDQAEEEFGFQTTGGLVLPCEPDFFQEILRFLDEDEERYCVLSLEEFLNVVFGNHTTSFCSKEDSVSSFMPQRKASRVSH